MSSGAATGTITVWAMGAEGENLPKLTKEFEAANPGVKVQVTAIPWDAAHDKFTTAITANKTPDVAMVGTTWMGEFAGMDALDPTPGADRQVRLLRRRAEDHRGERHLASASRGTSRPALVYYRTDLAKKAGITTPPTDWDGLKDMAKAMQDKAGAKYGIGLQAGGTGSWQSVMPFAWSDGRRPHQGRRQGLQLRQPRGAQGHAVLPVVLHRRHLRQGGPGDPDDRARLRQRQGADVHLRPVDDVRGREGRRRRRLQGQVRRRADPGRQAGPRRSSVARTSSSSRTPRTATPSWKFVQWLVRPQDPGRSGTRMSTDLPSVKSAWQDPALTADKKLAVFGKQLETAKAPPSFPTWEQVVTAFDTEMEKVTKTGADPAAALKTVQKQAESIGTG